jgi:hypothetical protein
MQKILASLAIAALVLVACGTDSPEVGAAPTNPIAGDAVVSDPLPRAGDGGDTTFAGMGPGVSVADLLASSASGPFLVNGYVFVRSDGSVVLADLIAESFPPQPAGAQIDLRGFDLVALPMTEGPTDVEIAITAWTDMPVQLLGEFVDGALVADPASSA